MLRYVQRPGDRTYFERPDDMSPTMHRLLIQRGISSLEEARAFLNPCEEQLHDPMLLSDMPLAAERIRAAMDRGEHICVYGDYDVDGVCASAILSDYLREEGADVEVYLPSRHNEGYGLNENALREIAQRSGLLVTVDCGVASRDLIELAKELGLACVVTDHHRPGELVPDCPLVNPLLADYPFPYLCGAGVAFKLVWALGGRDAAMDRIDLAAIATVADVVSLTGENRVIVRLGIEKMNRNPRPGVAALMESARIESGMLDSQGIAFRLGPRLNAGGRLGSARRAYDLLMEPDAFVAIARADELEQENARRQSVEKEIRAAAELQLKDFDFSAHRILLVRGEGWNSGVIGLTASHLKEKYRYPVIALAEEDGLLTGSCRSIPGVDIYQTLCSASDLMERFGGHSQAAGLTLKAENFEALWAALDSYLFENISPEHYLPTADYDIPAPLDECTEALVQSLAALEPTGCGNPEPVFRAEVQLLEARAIGKDGGHLRLVCAGNGARCTGIWFGAGGLAERLGESAEILFTPQLNVWNGRTSVQLRLCALRENDPLERIRGAKGQEMSAQRRFLTELFYNRRINTSSMARPITMDDLRSRLAGGGQGCFILCPDLDSARYIMEGIGSAPLDLSIGSLPEDSRAFNCLAVYPGEMNFPKGLRTLVLAGMPLPEGAGEDVEILSLEVDSSLWRELPDIEQMRAVYRAARNLSRRPVRLANVEALDAVLADESGLSATCCHASLLAMMEMQLIQLRERPFGLILPPMQKTDPNTSAAWRAMQRLREETEGRAEA